MWSAETAIKRLRRIDGIQSRDAGRRPNMVTQAEPMRMGIFHASRDTYVHRVPCSPPNLPFVILGLGLFDAHLPDLVADWIHFQASSIDAVLDDPGSMDLMPRLGTISVLLHRLAETQLQALGIAGFQSFATDRAMYTTI